MNPAQKKLLPIMPQPDDAKNEFSRGTNFGVTLANGALAFITIFDFATLDQVPAVEWVSDETDYGRSWTTPHSGWEIYEIDPGTQDQRCDAINEDDDSCKSFIAIDDAKRYVEIKLQLAAIERKLMKELVEK